MTWSTSSPPTGGHLPTCLRHPDGSVDKAESRRIEIQFQMDDRTLAHRVLELGAILIDPECE